MHKEPSNLERLLIELFDARSKYMDFLERDKLCEGITSISFDYTRSVYHDLLIEACATGYALKRKYGLDGKS